MRQKAKESQMSGKSHAIDYNDSNHFDNVSLCRAVIEAHRTQMINMARKEGVHYRRSVMDLTFRHQIDSSAMLFGRNPIDNAQGKETNGQIVPQFSEKKPHVSNDLETFRQNWYQNKYSSFNKAGMTGEKPQTLDFDTYEWFLHESQPCPICQVSLSNRGRLLQHLIESTECRLGFYDLLQNSEK